MKITDWILKIKANHLVLLLLTPLILCFFVLLVVDKGDGNQVLNVIFLGLILQLSIYTIYTTLLGLKILQEDRAKSDASKLPLPLTAFFSVIGFIWLYAGTTHHAYAATSFSLLLISLSELVRAYFLAKTLLAEEIKQPKTFWNYLTTMWIILYPLLGIWALRERTKHLLKD